MVVHGLMFHVLLYDVIGSYDLFCRLRLELLDMLNERCWEL